jgi:hypothetical protein
MNFFLNLTIYSLLISLYLFDGFLGDGLLNNGLHLIPGRFSWACEILSSLVGVFFFIYLSIGKKIRIRLVYVLFFFFLTIYLLSGIVLNAVPSGAIFAGIRRYFVFIPLFFLPSVYDFTEKQIKNQLYVILLFSIIQIPFSIYQRFYLFKYLSVGDMVTGTLLSSAVLTLNQVLFIAILSALYIKKKIRIKLFIFFLALLVLPTAINETKATLILLPIAISVPIFLGTDKIFNFKKFFLICATGIVTMAIFIPLYNHIYDTNLIEFFSFSNEDAGTKSIKGYLYRGLTVEETDQEAGRIDALLFPFKILHKKPFKLLFGLGIGNVNSSGIGRFKGEYTHYDKYGANTISVASMIWEIGILGFLLHLSFFYLVLQDAFKLKSSDSIFGALALGWIAIVIMLFTCLFYANIFHIKVIGYLFFYFSGIIASKRIVSLDSN